MLEYMQGWCNYRLENLHDEKERARVCGIDESAVRKDVLAIVTGRAVGGISGKSPKKYITVADGPVSISTKKRAGMAVLRVKLTLKNVGGRLPNQPLDVRRNGHTDEAKKELISLFGGRSPFDTPKPTRLLDFV